MEFVPVIIYILLLGYLGYRSRRRGADDEEFLLSSRSLTVPAFVATLVSTWYGGILGVGEFVYSYGVSVWFVFGLPYYLFALLFAWLVAPKVRAANSYSIPDMLYRVYGRPGGLLGSLFLIIMTSPAPYILMLALLIQYVFGVDYFWSLLAGTFFSIFYVYQGGFRAVVQTDKLQFLLMFGGFILLLIYLLHDTLSVPQMFSQLDALHKDPAGGMSWQNLLVWFLIASWTFIDPGFHQRCAAAKTPQVARRGIIISVAFWFVFDSLTMITGLYAVVLLPHIQPMMAYPLLAQKVLPPVINGLFLTGLLAIVMSTIDSYTFLSALTFGRDIWGQWRRTSSSKRAVQAGLGLTALIALVLIYLAPSIIRLWYNLGSLFIPPLLLPLLAAYFPRWRLSAASTFTVMLLSFAFSFGAFLWGQTHVQNGQPQYLLNLEPFFPGMLLSMLWFAAGNLFTRNAAR